ncbi:GNAT family N-acetyltransferase [Mesobacillus maritimus]|uniref:GNAT family N-acetyltransferase n=1 Tax=Mesobacillus maritimus TaxID=1643336 RepID=UPI00384E47BA
MREITSGVVHPTIRELLSYATTMEKVDYELARYIDSSNRKLYEYLLNDEIVGFVVVRIITSQHDEIKHIAVLPKLRGQSIGSKMVKFVCEKHGLSLISAETDCDAEEFYRKYGFEVINLGEKYPGVKRFRCEYKVG